MPAPVVIPVSSSELNVTWQEPTYEQSRGIVTRYSLWFYKASDLEKNPFAPPFVWVVSPKYHAFHSHTPDNAARARACYARNRNHC